MVTFSSRLNILIFLTKMSLKYSQYILSRNFCILGNSWNLFLMNGKKKYSECFEVESSVNNKHNRYVGTYKMLMLIYTSKSSWDILEISANFSLKTLVKNKQTRK